MPPVHVIAKFIAKPDCVDDAREAVSLFVEPSRAQAGCRFYELQQSQLNPAVLYTVACWDSTADFDNHGSSSEVADVLNVLVPHLLTEPEVTPCTQLSQRPTTKDR